MATKKLNEQGSQKKKTKETKSRLSKKLNEQGSKKKKIVSEQAKLEASNLIEQASDMMSTCIRCGKCKVLSPIIKATGQEHLGPRGQAILLGEKIIDKTVYQTTLCKGAEIKCPLNIPIDEALLKARQALVLKNQTLKQNEKMIANLKATGNPYVDEEGETDTTSIYT